MKKQRSSDIALPKHMYLNPYLILARRQIRKELFICNKKHLFKPMLKKYKYGRKPV